MPPPIPGDDSSSDVGDLDNIESVEPIEKKASPSKANGKVTRLPERGTSRSVDDEEDGDEEGDGGEEPDVYIVEAIVGHEFINHTLLYNVKWEGYAITDNTLEPEENLLPDAAVVLAAYHKSIGGTPQEPRDHSKKKGQARPTKPAARSPSASDLAPGPKRQKTSASATSTPAAKSKVKGQTVSNRDEHTWLPKREDWEPDIDRVDTIDRNEAGNLMVFLVFKNGKKTKVSMDQVYRHCPRPMLRFYEEHLKFN